MLKMWIFLQFIHGLKMIINTFISDTEIVPTYTEISLRQARKLNPSLPIHFICKNKPLYFDDLNITWINQDSINGDLITFFNNLSWFNRHGTPQTTHRPTDSIAPPSASPRANDSWRKDWPADKKPPRC